MKKVTTLLLTALITGAAVVATGPTAHAADRTCRGTIVGTTVTGNVHVPAGATCQINRSTVKGDVKLGRGASLTTFRARISGNVQGEDAPHMITLSRSQLGGSVQTKNATSRVYLYYTGVDGSVQGERNRYEQRLFASTVKGDVQTKYMSTRIDNSTIGGNVQHVEGRVGRLARTSVGGDVQFFSNRGEQRISYNRIGGNLQCKGNNPRPVGGVNVVSGNKEEQCARL